MPKFFMVTGELANRVINFIEQSLKDSEQAVGGKQVQIIIQTEENPSTQFEQKQQAQINIQHQSKPIQTTGYAQRNYFKVCFNQMQKIRHFIRKNRRELVPNEQNITMEVMRNIIKEMYQYSNLFVEDIQQLERNIANSPYLKNKQSLRDYLPEFAQKLIKIIDQLSQEEPNRANLELLENLGTIKQTLIKHLIERNLKFKEENIPTSMHQNIEVNSKSEQMKQDSFIDETTTKAKTQQDTSMQTEQNLGQQLNQVLQSFPSQQLQNLLTLIMVNQFQNQNQKTSNQQQEKAIFDKNPINSINTMNGLQETTKPIIQNNNQLTEKIEPQQDFIHQKQIEEQVVIQETEKPKVQIIKPIPKKHNSSFVQVKKSNNSQCIT